MNKQFDYGFVGLPRELSFLLTDVATTTTGKYPAFSVATKSTNGVVTSKNIFFYLKPVLLNLSNPASQTVENELRYYNRISTNIYVRPENPFNRKGNSTGLPKSTITYTNTELGSIKTVRDETPFYTFNCLTYDFMMGKTPQQIEEYCGVFDVKFKGGEAVAGVGTGISFKATVDRVSKDAFPSVTSLDLRKQKIWDACSFMTTYTAVDANHIRSVFPRLSIEGSKIMNNTFVNEVFWKDFPLTNKINIGGKTTVTTPSFTYRLKLLNGCQYASVSESQAILGYGLFGQCGGYYDFYNDETIQNADGWDLVKITEGEPRIEGNTIYYNPAIPAFLMMEATLAPKSTPNAKVWSTDVCIDLRDAEQKGDYLIWFSDKN
jgi:hypothetical protein